MRRYFVRLEYYISGKLFGGRTFEFDNVEEARKLFNQCKVNRRMYIPKGLDSNALERMAPFKMNLELLEVATQAVTYLDTYKYEGGNWYVQNYGETIFPEEKQ